jgi:hypothetical protein
MEFAAQHSELGGFQFCFVQGMGLPFGLLEIASSTATPFSTDQNPSNKMERFVSANLVTIGSTIEGPFLGAREKCTYKQLHP